MQTLKIQVATCSSEEAFAVLILNGSTCVLPPGVLLSWSEWHSFCDQAPILWFGLNSALQLAFCFHGKNTKPPCYILMIFFLRQANKCSPLNLLVNKACYALKFFDVFSFYISLSELKHACE